MDVFANMKLKTRILSLVALLLALMMGVAVYAGWSLAVLGGELEVIAKEDMPLRQLPENKIPTCQSDMEFKRFKIT